jgi:predicted permease
LSREIDEEIQSHIQEAIEQGRDPSEARRAFGNTLRKSEESRRIKLIPWLDGLRSDAAFGWRRLRNNKVTTAAAILSLALAIGACTSAFRLIDAILLRPLPVKTPQLLYGLARNGAGPDGTPRLNDGWAYPDFTLMRAAVKDQAELIAVSWAERTDLTYRSDAEMEKAYVQYVSGWMFDTFGIKPAIGRLLSEDDDLVPGKHAFAVLSHDYWTRHFANDPKVIGRTFTMGKDVYEIIGVTDGPFTGTEPGKIVDVYVPMMMNPFAVRNDATWIRTLAMLKPGVPIEPLRAKLDATSRAFEEERAKGFRGLSKVSIDRFLDQTLVIEPAAAGISGLQKEYRRSLWALAVLVALVLLIACANVANLMTAQASSRAREMALRVSIGAGRWRLLQLVLIESALLAVFASAIGALFAWWSAPFVVSRINPPEYPARLVLSADWRVVGFGLALTFIVMLLFGLAPALKASAVNPISALKGGEDPHSRRRLMHALIAAQVAFCFLVLFVAGLFVTTFERLSNRPLGFTADRLLVLNTVAERGLSPAVWDQAADRLRTVAGVEKVALADGPLPHGSGQNGFISINDQPPGPVLVSFLSVTPGWVDTMQIRFVAGRDFRPGDTSPGVAIVNETFVKQFFDGINPIGKTFGRGRGTSEIVGVVNDSPPDDLRRPTSPVAYRPFHALSLDGSLRPVSEDTFMVRTTAADPQVLASTLRQEIERSGLGLRVANITNQIEIIQSLTVRERLLAMLASFFAIVALVLAGVGLYGVLHYSVLQRRREIGIRIALGARIRDIASRVTLSIYSMVLVGAAAGLAFGMISSRYIDALFYAVRSTDFGMMAIPSVAILVVALLAALVPVIRASRIDPAKILRSE